MKDARTTTFTFRLIWNIATCFLFVFLMPASAGFAQAVSQEKPALDLGPEAFVEAQRRLSELGYWVGPLDGKWGRDSRHGLIAFQKVERRNLTGELNQEELQALRAAERPEPLDSSFAHVEVDIARQVLYLVDADGKVELVLPVSTGNEAWYKEGGRTKRASTPRGSFTIYRKINGWRLSPLGLLYYPNYINEGVAIHGSFSVPMFPASHGCIRIPMNSALAFSTKTPIGTAVIVY